MNPEMRIIREVNIEAENFYEDAVSLGDHAAYALKAVHRAQITGLESIAESSFKTSDVFDYLKKQIARFTYWRLAYPEDPAASLGFGERLKRYLEENLAQKLDDLCDRLKKDGQTTVDPQTRRRIYLLLIRQFLRQMAAEYEYQVSPGTKKEP